MSTMEIKQMPMSLIRKVLKQKGYSSSAVPSDEERRTRFLEVCGNHFNSVRSNDAKEMISAISAVGSTIQVRTHFYKDGKLVEDIPHFTLSKNALKSLTLGSVFAGYEYITEQAKKVLLG